MSKVACPNLSFHSTPRGQKLEKSYEEMGSCWMFDKKENFVECMICLHDDNGNEVFLQQSEIYKKIKNLWKDCQHKKITLSSGNMICRDCLILHE